MGEPDKRAITSQSSFSHIEQSMRIIPTPQDVPIVIYPGPKSDMANMSKADLEIAQRLQRLRRSSKEVPTEDDVKSKLAKLKGKPADYYTNSSTIQHFAPEERSQTEQADSLLAQLMDEVKLEAAVPNSEHDITARLAMLRGNDPPPLGFSQPSSIQSIPSSGNNPAPYGFSGLYDADVDMKEVDSLMMASKKELTDAQQSLDSLNKDAAISAAIASTALTTKKDKKDKKKNKKLKKKKEKKIKSDTSSDEKFSNSDSEYDKKMYKTSSHSKEKQEVDRIVDMYSSKAAAKSDRKSSNSSSIESSSSSEYMSQSSSPHSD